MSVTFRRFYMDGDNRLSCVCKVGGIFLRKNQMRRGAGQEDKMFNYPTIDMVKTGQNIMRLRIQNGYSVRDLQNVFGFSTPQAIYKWQSGISMPTIDNLVVLARLFRVQVDDILIINDGMLIRLTG